MYQWMLESASTAGYQHYEISNLCLPGFESRHNSKYWTGSAYYGFGCSAHSFDGTDCRWSNERDVNTYVQLIERSNQPFVEEQRLSLEDRQAEAVFLGLRMMRGVDTKEFERVFGRDIREEHKDDFKQFEEAGLIEFDGDLLRLTRAGALMSNEVFARFV
jgi:oxygen-independent coproporphyrinogen-3 oxidase